MSKKISIVTPNEREMLDGAGDRMPLGAMYVATAAKRAGHDVTVYDLNHDDRVNVMNEAFQNPADIVGWSIISSPSYNEMNEMMSQYKKIAPVNTSSWRLSCFGKTSRFS